MCAEDQRSEEDLFLCADGVEPSQTIDLDGMLTMVRVRRPYGSTYRIWSPFGCAREARVTDLGEDGWVVRVRDHSLQRWGWPGSMLVTRPVSLPGEGAPAEEWLRLVAYQQQRPLDDFPGMVSPDVAGINLLETAEAVSTVVGGWLLCGRVPSPYDVGDPRFDAIRCDSVDEAMDRVDPEVVHWRPDVRAAVNRLAAESSITQVFLINPTHIVARTAASEEPIELVLRTRGDVCVYVARDGAEEKVVLLLPSGERIHPPRVAAGMRYPREPDPVTGVLDGDMPRLWGQRVRAVAP